MSHLALTFWLLAVPAVAERPFQVSPGAAMQVVRTDPCAVAKQIAAQRPCLRPEDCGAFQDWKRLFGAPRTEPLNPEFVGGGVARASRQLEANPKMQQVPMSFLCLAAESSDGVVSNVTSRMLGKSEPGSSSKEAGD